MPRATLRRKLAITLTAARNLRVADLTGYGLRRLGATRAEIIDSDPRSYRIPPAGRTACIPTASTSTASNRCPGSTTPRSP